VNLIAEGANSTPQCPGTIENPTAEPGNLCIYEQTRIDAKAVNVVNPTNNSSGGASNYGFEILVESEGADYDVLSQGSWAVTAP
jgi:hypothetical protein